MNATEATREPDETDLRLTPEQQRFVEENMPLARKFASQFRAFANHADDILSESMRGLCQAASDHDPDVSTFGFHAYRYMGYCVYKYLGSLPPVHIPNYLRYQQNRKEGDRHWLAPKAMAAMSTADRVKAIDVAESRFAAPEKPVEDADEMAWLDAHLGRLGERSRNIVRRRMAGEKLRVLGDEMGLTRERVRQIEREAVARLQKLAQAGGMA